MTASLLGLGALAVILGTGAFWLRRMQQVRTAGLRGRMMGLNALGVALALAALGGGPGWPGGIAAGLALVAGGVFLTLQTLSRQPALVPAVQVGGPILDFSAPDDAGERFDLASLRGRPFLLKFFRGHW